MQVVESVTIADMSENLAPILLMFVDINEEVGDFVGCSFRLSLFFVGYIKNT